MGKRGAIFVAIYFFLFAPILTAGLTLKVLYTDKDFKIAHLWSKPKEKVNEFGLTEFEMKNGIGPIKKKMDIGITIDEALAKEGAEVFKLKCSGCHNLDKRYVGPALRGVTNFRSPEYLMNMILNTHEMIRRHPIAKGLYSQFLIEMSPQNMDEKQARAVLEYLRKESK